MSMQDEIGGVLEGSTVGECRSLLETDSASLNYKFHVQVWYGLNIDKRLKMFDDGVVALGLDIIRKNSPNHASAIKEAWKMITKIVVVYDVEDDKEYIPTKKLVELGGIPLISAEFQKRRAEKSDTTDLLYALSWCAASSSAIVPIVQSEAVHKYAISVLNDGPTHEEFDHALSLIRNLAAGDTVKAKLRNDGALNAVLPFVNDIKSDDENKFKHGYRASSVVARLVGKDEQGEAGFKILHGNPVLISKMLDTLNKALDAGPKGTVMKMLINPHNITMDLLTIATSDVNKPLLKNAIPILVKSLKVRGETNHEMVVDIVKTLLQLTFDKECLHIMGGHKEELINLIQTLVVPPKYNIEALMSVTNLVNALTPSSRETSGNKRFGLFGFRRNSAKAPKALGGSDSSQEKFTASGTLITDKHVMLSYNWGVKSLVRRVDELLRANGIKTWLDDRDMGPNLNDSMAQAIENAYVVFAFMTSEYKESANCRKECEYADDCKVPIVYIMAEEGYKPNGWLGLQLGKSLWIGCWQVEMVDRVLPSLLQRAKPSSGGQGGSSTADSTLSARKGSIAPSVAAAGSGGPDLVRIASEMEAMANEIKQLRLTQDELRSRVVMLEKRLDLQQQQ